VFDIVERVIFMFLPFDEFIHSAEHIAFLVAKKSLKRFVLKLHVLFYADFQVFTLIQLAKVTDHILGDEFFLQHPAILAPHHIRLREFVLVFFHKLQAPSPKNFRSNVIYVAVHNFRINTVAHIDQLFYFFVLNVVCHLD
jgi:hypothetical protein